MDCQGCGRREATINTFVADQDSAEYWQLCEQCCEDMVAENEAAALERVRADPAATVQQMETNLGRALTLAECAALDHYLAQPTQLSPHGTT